jgi:hypothetical protein
MTGGPATGRGALEVILFEETRFRGSLMFTSTEVTVGSAPGVMIHLDDSTISPCHAVLRFDGETCTVENYDPILGTQVNGEAMEQREVFPTDEIQVGRFRLRINVHRAEAAPTPLPVRPPARPLPPPPKAPVASAPGKVVPLPVPPAPPVPTRASAARMPTPGAPASVPAVRPVQPFPAPARTPKKSEPGASIPSASAAKALPPPVPPAPAPRPTTAMPTASARRPSSGRPVSAAAPAALAVAPVLAGPSPRQAPPVTQPRPALSSVPAESPPPAGRTSTQPIVSGYTEYRTEVETNSEMFDFCTVRSEFPDPSSQSPGCDDDDDDAIFEPSFSLFERLRESGMSSHKSSAVEVIRFRHGCILKLHHMHRGEKLRLYGLRKPLGRCSGAGGFVFQRDALPESIAVSKRGKPFDDASWRLHADRRGRIVLDAATQVLFPLPSGEGILVHLVPAAGPLPKSTWRPRLTKLMVALGAISVLVHLIVFAILGLASLVRHDYIADKKEGRFARIALKEIELEPPPPPPKREKKKAKAEPTQTATTEPTPKVATPHIPRTRTPTAPQAQSTATAQKLLSALGGLSPGPKPMSATAMSNLDAAGPVHGGGFKVSGAIGKLPGDSLRLAAAGSGMGRLDTKSSNDVGKNLGRVLGHAPTGQVRAQVTAKPNMMKVEGHLDRGEIQKVINAHIHELQGCFERQLVVNPNLAGKVSFEWVIGTSGAVTVVKIKASSLSSNEATSCMQAAIHRWRFPAPSGGQVTVVYPIALANSGT